MKDNLCNSYPLFLLPTIDILNSKNIGIDIKYIENADEVCLIINTDYLKETNKAIIYSIAMTYLDNFLFTNDNINILTNNKVFQISDEATLTDYSKYKYIGFKLSKKQYQDEIILGMFLELANALVIQNPKDIYYEEKTSDNIILNKNDLNRRLFYIKNGFEDLRKIYLVIDLANENSLHENMYANLISVCKINYDNNEYEKTVNEYFSGKDNIFIGITDLGVIYKMVTFSSKKSMENLNNYLLEKKNKKEEMDNELKTIYSCDLVKRLENTNGGK